MSKRQHDIKRKTSETDIILSFNIDGKGHANVDTGVPFLDHMLVLFAKHGLFDLSVVVKGDVEVDGHHTTEDVGICLGEAFRHSIGDAKGITRYASGDIPMDESLCRIACDVSNRSYLSFEGFQLEGKIGQFDAELVEEFFRAFVSNARLTLHVDLIRGKNLHHISEASFKALGVVLDRATRIDLLKGKDVPSTKGVL